MKSQYTYSKKLMKHFKKPKHVKSLKNPDGVGEVGNPSCVLPNQKIILNGKYKEISKSQKRDIVITHNNQKKEVIGAFNRNFKGKKMILTNAMGKISLTPEHLVYGISVPNRRKFKSNKGKLELIPAWYHCEDLKKGDIVLYPIPNKIKDKKFLDLNIPKLKWDFRSNPIPKKIPLNRDFLRLSGYYLSEGHISEKKCNNYISLSFNINETHLAEDVKKIVKKIFNLDVKMRYQQNKNVLVVCIYSARLSRFFKRLFNKGAQNKSIPKMFMNLPLRKQKALIRGLWEGDGCVNINRKGPRAGYVTISYSLSQQIKELLLRQKIFPSIYIEKEKISKWANHKKAYRVHVGQRDSLQKLCKILGLSYKPKSYKSITSWFDNKYLYTPITNVQNEPYSEKVYNLEVQEDHSFISEAFILHNCGDIMHLEIKVKKDKKTGKDKIKKIGFKTFGCPAAIASSDVVCQVAKGKTLEDAKKMKKDVIVKELGGMPPVKVHCSILGIQALKKAIEDYEKKKEDLN